MSVVRIHHDKETFSETDLTKVGAYKYAACPTTDCLLTSGLVEGDDRIRRWRPGDPFPYADIHPDDIEILAWNSQFERLIWKHVMVPLYGWPRLALEQFVCVSAQARSTAAGPSKLDVAGQFFYRRNKKDNKGHLHMLKMCRPAKEDAQLKYLQYIHGAKAHIARDICHPDELKRCHHTRADLDRLHDYCDQDVRTEADIHHILPEWEMPELEAFWESERINDHGLIVDVDFARAASRYAEDEKAYFARRIAEITRNQVTTPRQFQRIKDWALPRMSAEAVKMTEWYDDGVKKYSFDADTRANLLTECARDAYFLDEDVQEFVEVLDMAGNSTISKYETIATMAMWHEDQGVHRVHGLYMFAGAAQSGRYSSVKLQVHNLKRDVPGKDGALAPALIQAFKRDKGVAPLVKEWVDVHNAKLKSDQRKLDPEPVHALGRLVRPTITGCPHDTFDLVWCDWSSIEACVLPWLSLHPDADERLAVFRRGEDLYIKTASRLTGRKITKEDEFERQAFGKVPELSMGYGGFAGAYAAMAKNYGVSLEEKRIIKICQDWRADNPWAADKHDGFWARLEQAAIQAILKPGTSYSAGRVAYTFDPDALDGIGALFAILPSGRRLAYPDARLDVQATKWGKDRIAITAMKSAWRPKKGDTDWPRVSVWHGLLAENVTQAVATGDLLNEALLNCRAAGLTVCSHTHDEIMIETPAPERDGAKLKSIMLRKPKWPGADALPLNAELGSGYRYKVKFPDEKKMKVAA